MKRQDSSMRWIMIALLLAGAALVMWILLSDSGVPADTYKL